MTVKIDTQREEARDRLRELLPPGSNVKTILRHVSRSGKSRAISPVVDNEDVSWLVCRANPSLRFDRRYGGIKMKGYGKDMGLTLVYDLSRCLGYELRQQWL